MSDDTDTHDSRAPLTCKRCGCTMKRGMCSDPACIGAAVMGCRHENPKDITYAEDWDSSDMIVAQWCPRCGALQFYPGEPWIQPGAAE